MTATIYLEKNDNEFKYIDLGNILKNISPLLKWFLPATIKIMPYQREKETGGTKMCDFLDEITIFENSDILSFISISKLWFNVVLATLELANNKINTLESPEKEKLLNRININPTIWGKHQRKYLGLDGKRKSINLDNIVNDIIYSMHGDPRYDPDFDLDYFVENEYEEYVKKIEEKVKNQKST